MANYPPLISIITINFNSLEVTTELLDSIRRINYSNLEIIVVDNASTDDPSSILKQKYPEIQVLRSEKNLGFSGGNNLGIKASNGEYLFFVNNDTELIDGCIEQLVSLFNKVDDLGIVSPIIYHHPDYHKQKGHLIQYAGTTTVNPITARNRTIGAEELDRGQFTEPVQTPYVHGAAMIISRTVLEKVGLMPEVYFLYYEELDWCEQIRKSGFKIYLEPNAKIFHKESVSVGKMSTLKTYYLTRNRILFTRRHRSSLEVFLFTLFLILFTIPKNILMYLIKGEWKHARVFLKGILWHLKSESREAKDSRPKSVSMVLTSNQKYNAQ